MDLSQEFYRRLQENRLVSSGDSVLVALSGGGDSVALLHLLAEHKDRLGIRLGACHVHHGIRGKEADEDLAFCRKLCRETGIPFFEKKVDVPAYCHAQKAGLEEGARILRYEALAHVAEENGFDKIATAHTASDQAETVLFRLLRGTGFSGLRGIPIRRGAIIRPLLSFHREELVAFLDGRHLMFTQDSSNFDTIYSRNRIRHEALPLLKEIHNGAEDSLLRLAALAEWQDALCEELCDEWEKKNGLPFSQGKAFLSILSPLAEKTSRYPILFCILQRMTRGTVSLNFERFSALLPLLKTPVSGKIVEMEKGCAFTFQTDCLVFGANEEKKGGIDFQREISEGENEIPEIGASLWLSPEKSGNAQNFQKNDLIIHVSCDMIKGALYARNYRSGDSVTVNGMTQSLKKMFSAAKISAAKRNALPILCDHDGILWVPFVGLSDRARPEHAGRHRTVTLHLQKETDVEK